MVRDCFCWVFCRKVVGWVVLPMGILLAAAMAWPSAVQDQPKPLKDRIAGYKVDWSTAPIVFTGMIKEIKEDMGGPESILSSTLKVQVMEVLRGQLKPGQQVECRISLRVFGSDPNWNLGGDRTSPPRGSSTLEAGSPSPQPDQKTTHPFFSQNEPYLIAAFPVRLPKGVRPGTKTLGGYVINPDALEINRIEPFDCDPFW
ncbi:MAG: hypothetical protein RMI90_02260 [Thermoguttaceae bacterium]|nr:hypothetical protein [Thermoguttaceae bacterium]